MQVRFLLCSIFLYFFLNQLIQNIEILSMQDQNSLSLIKDYKIKLFNQKALFERIFPQSREELQNEGYTLVDRKRIYNQQEIPIVGQYYYRSIKQGQSEQIVNYQAILNPQSTKVKGSRLSQLFSTRITNIQLEIREIINKVSKLD